MTQGKKAGDKIIAEAMAMLAMCNNAAEVARKFNVSRSTVVCWKKKYDEQAEANGEPNFDELRTQYKKEFSDRAWKNIGQIQTLLDRRLARALESESVMDEVVRVVQSAGGSLSEEKRKNVLNKLYAMRVDNVRELAVLLGTLFDKQALANKEETNIVGVKKLEDFDDD